MTFKKPFRASPIKLGAHYRDKRYKEARKRRVSQGAYLGLVVTSATAMFVLVWSIPTTANLQPASGVASMPSNVAAGEPISGCRVTDGDTIRCGNERIRLLAIDAPELPGHCRQERICAPGDPIASTESLREALAGDLRIRRFGEDRYGRTLGLVAGAKGNLSCWQLQHRQAVYLSDWDDGGSVARACPRFAR